MQSSHLLVGRGWPLGLWPLTLPSIAFFGHGMFCILLMWPKYFNLSTTILFSTSCPGLVILWFLCYESCPGWSHPVCSGGMSFHHLSSLSRILRHIAVQRISVWYNCTLVWLLILLDVQILLSSWKAAQLSWFWFGCHLYLLDPLSAIVPPRYNKSSTFSLLLFILMLRSHFPCLWLARGPQIYPSETSDDFMGSPFYKRLNGDPKLNPLKHQTDDFMKSPFYKHPKTCKTGTPYLFI